MDTDKIAEIIHDNTHSDPMAPTNTGLSTYISHDLIGALAYYLEAEGWASAHHCSDWNYCDWKPLDRTEFIRIARDGS